MSWDVDVEGKKINRLDVAAPGTGRRSTLKEPLKTLHAPEPSSASKYGKRGARRVLGHDHLRVGRRAKESGNGGM